jgi:hypothetical protein
MSKTEWILEGSSNSLVNLVFNLQLIATQGFLSANQNMDLY